MTFLGIDAQASILLEHGLIAIRRKAQQIAQRFQLAWVYESFAGHGLGRFIPLRVGLALPRAKILLMGGRKKEARRRVGCLTMLMRFLLMGFLLALAGGLVAFAVAYRMVSELSQGLPDVRRLDHYEPAETTRIYAADGSLIATLFQENRTWVPLKKIAPGVVQALLATEDSRFYEHGGVDWVGVGRAVYVDLTHRGRREGASTITMQLARNLFLSPEPSMKRKVKEAVLAQRIEKEYSKDKILELYLNQVYFGAGAYGIAAAASLYREKPADKLSAAESALLVGLLQAPSAYSPLVDPKAARTRAEVVLGRMLAVEALTPSEHKKAVAEVQAMRFPDSQRDKTTTLLKYPYFTTYVIRELSVRYPEEVLYRSGLKVHTTLDIKVQQQAERILREEVQNAAYALNVDTGAAVLVENQTGYIRAMVGGTGYSKTNQFNRAWQALRQPGSSFKVIVYACALENGFAPDSVVADSPVSYNVGGTTWTPKNSDGQFMGEIPLRTALQHSRNVVAVKLLSQLGIDPVISLAYKMGIKQELPPHLSIALGSTEVSPLEMAEVFSVVANGGIRRRPTAIKLVQDSHGEVVEDHRRPDDFPVLRPETASSLTDMLVSVVTSGTGTRAQVPGRPIAGKTGTTDSFKDAWFCGFSPQFTLAVWVGNNDNSPMWRSFGGDLPAAIFRQIMGVALQGAPVGSFPRPTRPSAAAPARPDREVSLRLCSQTRLMATEGCPEVEDVLMKPSAAPADICKVHLKASDVAPPPADLLPPDEPVAGEDVPLAEETPSDEWVDEGPSTAPPTPMEILPPPQPAPAPLPAPTAAPEETDF